MNNELIVKQGLVDKRKVSVGMWQEVTCMHVQMVLH